MNNRYAVFDALNGGASCFVTFGNQFIGEKSLIDESGETVNRSEGRAEFV